MAQSTETLLAFLTRTPFFGGLEERALERIVSMLTERRLDAGSAVFYEGDTGRSMYVIGSGEVVMARKGESGRQIRLVRLMPGDFFGEPTLIEMQPRPSTARVDKATVLYELTNMDLYRLYREDVHAYVMVLQNINRELCRRLRKADNRILEFADDSDEEVTQIKTPPLTPTPRKVG